MLPKSALTMFKYPGLRCADLELTEFDNTDIGKQYKLVYSISLLPGSDVAVLK